MRYIISLLLASTAPLCATPLWADAPRVVTDIIPVHSLVAQVMGDLGSPVLLLDTGASPHDFQLRPSQAANLAEAQLLVWIGPDLTPWLDRAVTSLAPDAARLTLLADPQTRTRPFAETEDAHADDAHDDHEDPSHDDHAHTGTDPHAWLDPGNATRWLGLIAAELSTLDPANAPTYAANAATAATSITALDQSLSAQLAPIKDRPFVVYHDAYGYFTAHYGLTLAGTVATGDATSPGAARLDALQDRLGTDTPLCLFPEVQHDPALVTQLAEGTRTRLGGPLDPEGSTAPAGPLGYEATLRGLADTLTACLLP